MKNLTIFNQNYTMPTQVANNLLAAKNRKETVAILLADGLMNESIKPLNAI
jgi:hypothetical protein